MHFPGHIQRYAFNTTSLSSEQRDALRQQLPGKWLATYGFEVTDASKDQRATLITETRTHLFPGTRFKRLARQFDVPVMRVSAQEGKLMDAIQRVGNKALYADNYDEFLADSNEALRASHALRPPTPQVIIQGSAEAAALKQDDPAKVAAWHDFAPRFFQFLQGK